MKRIAVIITLMVMMIATLPISTLLENESYFQKSMDSVVDTVESSESDTQLQSTNSVGNYVSDLAAKQSEEEAQATQLTNYNASITSVEFDPDSGLVCVMSTQPMIATVQVTVVTDDATRKKAAVVSQRIAKGEKIYTQLQIDTNLLPQYYEIQVDLIGPVNNEKLCDTYILSDFAQTMQEIKAATVDDFDPQYVVNLDEDTTTNFLVLNEETKIVESSDTVNTLLSADYENGVYVFANPDETVTNLQAGDMLFTQSGDTDFVAITVKDIAVEDGVATITETDEVSEDQFPFMKIESVTDLSDAVMDTSVTDESISDLELIEDEAVLRGTSYTTDFTSSLADDTTFEITPFSLKFEFSFSISITRIRRLKILLLFKTTEIW